MSCKTVTEIEGKVPEFEFREDRKRVVCTVCSASFKYDIATEGGKKVSDQLSDLKNKLLLTANTPPFYETPIGTLQ